MRRARGIATGPRARDGVKGAREGTGARRGGLEARNLSGDSRETGINGQLHKYNV